MSLPRFSIAGLMALVVCIALNLAAMRWLYSLRREVFAGLVLTAPCLELALWRLFRRAGRSRAFWAGFVICECIATSMFVWAMLTSPELAINPTTIVYYRGSWLWSLWEIYISFVDRSLWPSLAGTAEPVVLFAAVLVVVWSLPQLSAAAAGGLLAQWVFAAVRKPIASEHEVAREECDPTGPCPTPAWPAGRD